MSAFKTIEKKLHQFTKKYYVNELIKGSILFLSLGFLYLIFTLFIEYFLWLKPTARTFLFWVFILVELFLLIRFIVIPIFKLLGLRKGISLEESSKIIGAHFPEVNDKLLNVLQLKESSNQSDLLLASINQKSEELQPIPFAKAVDFKKNTKYLKYAIVPVLIWLITLISGNNGIFTQSLDRVVNHRKAYNPPAPFSFSLQNENLQVIQGKPITIIVNTVGTVLPSEAKIIYDNQQYFLQNNGNGTFSYTFSDVQKPIKFFVEANGVQSQNFNIEIINTPTINNIALQLNYPRYVGKRNETIQNTGNIIVPEGTRITWKVEASQTDSVAFINNKKRNLFKNISSSNFEFSKYIRNSLNYQITSSNENLKDYENLQFSVGIIKDEVPEISVQTNIDSISRGTAQFAGQISDDYGLSKLQIVYYDAINPQNQQTFNLEISRENIQTFFYQFPNGLNLKPGINYELFFEVFDNDAVNGNKKAKSKVFNYRQKTTQEIEQEILQEQRNTINSLENSIQKQEKQEKELNKIQEDLQNKKKLSWNDKKKVENFIKRQENYKKMMQRQTDELQENLDEKKEENENLQEKKEELKKRIEELKKLDKQQKLLDEIQKMADKLNKEDLVKKAKELAQQNKQQRRSLERMLELTKRFYVEQKTMQIANKLEELAKKQETLANKEDATLEDQKKINEEFKELKNELEELAKDNEKLKEPMELPDVEDEKEAIDKELKNSEENIKKQDKNQTKKSQKNSSNKMKEMSAKMQKAMEAMEGESIEENMEDLRKILENLVTFSFQQENLMNKFSDISVGHPDYGNDLKKQNDIRTYFEHIDDSLYVLSMRLPKISTQIQDDLSTAHYNLEQSLENFSENRFNNGISNQRYVMTSTNNLADYLSNILNNMKNSMSMKMGKGKKGDFSLPDIIKKQGELSEKMKEGMKKQGEKPGQKSGQKPGEGQKGGEEGKKPGDKGKPGSKGENGKSGDAGKSGKNGKGGKDGESGENGKGNGEGNGENDDLDGELYEIYKEQSKLRQELQNAIKESENGNPGGNAAAKKALKTMEQLENEILEKGFNAGTLQRMQRLNYELLKLDAATLEQGEDKKRKSTANFKESERNKVKALHFKKQFYNQIEILNRQSLPLQENYKIKVREYFSEPQKKEK
ncbi:hypothetical protein FDT66_06320 [Polaribacter aestuariivivens]|uniref:DUF4175 family protein n=1 Tax=Polaribacter aestuariivivens TaxID=2304626 RepID=A0A5S3N552_9FLAO|nr:DUF4175 family protein [Polaribacter aestuariivivens]TMM30373.1 hypothetical protein FDT66_06320 [Polaribacter aestuariivivens]